MTDEVQKGFKMGNPDDPMRMAQRIARLRQALTRAKGARAAELQAEIARHQARIGEIRAALDAAGV
jgi:hypothetical protein